MGRCGCRRGRFLRQKSEPSGAIGIIEVVSTPAKTPLLSVGHEAEWAAINREEEEQERAIDMALTPAQRVAQGEKLSQQAVALLAASIRAGHAPARTYWS